MTEERPQYLNPKDFYANHMDNWREYWDKNNSLYRNVFNIVSQSVFIPNKSVVLPIAVTYLLIPTKWSLKCGILFSFGDEGSGKSTIAKLATKIHGVPYVFSPSDTFASIRNALDGLRWIDPGTKEYEKEGAILCWDNIHTETLEKDIKIYQLLLFGYDRGTDKISIAGADGSNRDYHVYCPKIISSINPIHLVPQFGELVRRLFLIPHKKWEKFTSLEKKEYKNVDINVDRLDPDVVDWTDIEQMFLMFWNTPENCQNYVAWRKQLTKKGKRAFVIPPTMSSANWTISIDLIATGLVVGCWGNIQEAVDAVGNYWDYINVNFLMESTASMGHLKEFIGSEAGYQLNANSLLVNHGLAPTKIIISSTKLKNFMVGLQNEGKLDVTPRTKDTNHMMWILGWKHTVKGWEER
jgi:hypothetical protein